MKKLVKYFSAAELALWSGSVILMISAFVLFGGAGALTLFASLIGVTSLILAAKGNPLSPALMIIFSILYGIISYSFRYYGEMTTYLGMTIPMSVISLVSWLRNPAAAGKAEVKVNRIRFPETVLLVILTAAVTVLFYYILKYFGTANLIPSTISVSTSFAAAYLTFRRSEFFALAYAANDAVLIVLWSMASLADRSYVSVLVCFVVFLVNDIYGFISWKRMRRRQADMEKAGR